VVLEDLADHGSGFLGVRAEVVQLQHALVVADLQVALAAEGRDAALHRDARAREGGEVAGGVDEGNGRAANILDRFHWDCGTIGAA